jgi:tetratricopeptide (TPR) repeat protein
MATKPKSTATSTLPKALGDKLAKAIALVDGKKPAEAEGLLQELAKEAAEARHLGLERTVQTYLKICEAARPSKGPAIAPELQAQVHLNRRETREALELLEKALKAHKDRATLYYLKAVGHAQAGDGAAAAAAMTQALELDGDLRFVYRLEPDFDAYRREAAFVPFES